MVSPYTNQPIDLHCNSVWFLNELDIGFKRSKKTCSKLSVKTRIHFKKLSAALQKLTFTKQCFNETTFAKE